MKITKSFASVLIACVLISMGCKKSDQTVKMNQTAVAPPCEPVHIFTESIDSTYIVMLRNADNRSNSKQILGTATNEVNNILNRYAISKNQQVAILNNIHSGFIARLSRNQALALTQDENVELVEQDRVIALDKGCYEIVSPSSVQWGARMTGVGDGTGKRVWIIDTGVETDHPDLNVDTVLSKCFVSNQTSFEDNNGHGTHVAGIIGALNNSFGVVGVAAGAKIIALKALDDNGKGSVSWMINALNYIAQNAKAGEVVNMSLGADTISPALDNAVQTLANNGILFSIAAGNDARKADLSSPARVNNANVFTVSAIDSLKQFASFSDYGNDVVDYAAPGVRIISTYIHGQYARLSGTSMAAPHLAGILVVDGNKINSIGNTLDPQSMPEPIASF
ncbi:MAG TPA: S8 family serine peptidase [Puia sp.]|nr:S8 family serine peptidase [Puia sp.]